VRSWTRGAAASGAVSLLGVALQAAAPMASASCYGDECDQNSADYGCIDPNVAPSDVCCEQGYMPDENTWASTPQNALWLPFNASETLRLHIGAWTGSRLPEQGFSSIWIAPAPPQGPNAPFPDADPADAPVDITTLASGSLGEWPLVSPGLVEVENGTCAPMLVRVVIGFPPVDGGVPPEYIGPCQRHANAASQNASRADGG
jgi:hypothetical protein